VTCVFVEAETKIRDSAVKVDIASSWIWMPFERKSVL